MDRPTLEGVAARAGVSRATVSRVVNGQQSVDPALREQVLRAVAELGYVPNRTARTLVTQRTDMIALVIAESEQRVFGGDPFFTDITRGVSQELALADLQLVLMLARNAEDYARIERNLVPGHVDGVLLISQHLGDTLPARLVAAGVPAVIGGRPPEATAGVPYVDNDNEGGAELATRHLIDRGCTRIGSIAGPLDMTAGFDRLTGFRRAMGRRLRPGLVEHGDFTFAGGAAAAAALLARVPDVDALFVASDLMALGCLATLRRSGRRVPDDVAVVGFDGIDAGAEAEPALTTVRQRTVDQGRAMARMLLARSRGRTAAPGSPPDDDLPPVTADLDRLVLPVELVVRQSG